LRHPLGTNAECGVVTGVSTQKVRKLMHVVKLAAAKCKHATLRACQAKDLTPPAPNRRYAGPARRSPPTTIPVSKPESNPAHLRVGATQAPPQGANPTGINTLHPLATAASKLPPGNSPDTICPQPQATQPGGPKRAKGDRNPDYRATAARQIAQQQLFPSQRDPTPPRSGPQEGYPLRAPPGTSRH